MIESELEAFSKMRREPVELVERGDRVLALVAARARGRASGVVIESRARQAFTVRDGQIVRAESRGASAPSRAPRNAARGSPDETR
jgi:ketosteroid isomerase-like protein